jgi:hypothetical protein
MEKHLATIEYIKDILDEEDLNITFKKGKYVIKFIIDAKNSITIDAIAKLKVIGKKEKALSKLSRYFSKDSFKIQLETINEPNPRLMVMDSFSGNMYKKLLEKRIIHRSITANTTDPNLILNRFRDGQGIYYTSNTDIIIPNSY